MSKYSALFRYPCIAGRDGRRRTRRDRSPCTGPATLFPSMKPRHHSISATGSVSDGDARPAHSHGAFPSIDVGKTSDGISRSVHACSQSPKSFDCPFMRLYHVSHAPRRGAYWPCSFLPRGCAQSLLREVARDLSVCRHLRNRHRRD